jgi:uncharacterized membrane protein
MDNVEKLLERINKEGIKPTPKWVFTLRKGMIWGAFGLSILFGAVAFSVILYAIQQSDFAISNQLGRSGLAMVLAIMPIVWLLGILVFTGLSIYSIKNSKRGYKLEWLKVLNLTLLASIVLGTLLFLWGGAQNLEETFGHQFKGYESIKERKIEMWNQPDEGYLAGKITFSAGDELRLESYSGQEWKIKYEQAFIAPILQLVKDEEVKIIGSIAENGIFQAEEIRPWGGRPGMKKGEGKRNGQNGRNGEGGGF